MYYKVIINNKERILDSSRIKELVKENKKIEVRRLDNTKVDINYFKEKQHREKKEETLDYCYRRYQQKYYNRLKRNTISVEEYNKTIDRLKSIKHSIKTVSNFKKECELNKL